MRRNELPLMFLLALALVAAPFLSPLTAKADWIPSKSVTVTVDEPDLYPNSGKPTPDETNQEKQTVAYSDGCGFSSTYNYQSGVFKGTLTASSVTYTPVLTTRTVTGRRSSEIVISGSQSLQRNNDTSMLVQSVSTTAYDPQTKQWISGSIPLTSAILASAIFSGYDREWGYFWWMSDDPGTYADSDSITKSWTAQEPSVPHDMYDYLCTDLGSLASSGWTCIGTAWSSEVDFSTLGAGNGWAYGNDLYYVPPQRPGVEKYDEPFTYYESFANPPQYMTDPRGPWWSGERYNNYRQVAIIYYQKPWYTYNYDLTYSGTIPLPDYTETVADHWTVQVTYTGTANNTSSSNISGTVHVSPQYYEDTDVTGAVDVDYSTTDPDGGLVPSSNIRIRVKVNGTTVLDQPILCPVNNHSWIPFKFHTISLPASVDSSTETITVELDYTNAMLETNEADNTLTQTIQVVSAKYTEPAATTYQPNVPDGWQSITPPSNPSTSETDWQEWRYQNGSLSLKSFYARATASMELTPDSRIKSSTKENGVWTMRSGYGFTNATTYTFSTNYDNPSFITVPQRVRVYFPEFQYDMKDNLRQLESVGQTGSSSGYTINYAFKQNAQSRTMARLHFTPLWFPNGDYTVQENIRDIWTPNGQLTLWGTYQMNIDGSVYDDWSANEVTNQ